MVESLDDRIARALSLGPIDPWQLALMLHADLDDVIHECKLHLLHGSIELTEWHRYPEGVTLPAFQMVDI